MQCPSNPLFWLWWASLSSEQKVVKSKVHDWQRCPGLAGSALTAPATSAQSSRAPGRPKLFSAHLTLARQKMLTANFSRVTRRMQQNFFLIFCPSNDPQKIPKECENKFFAPHSTLRRQFLKICNRHKQFQAHHQTHFVQLRHKNRKNSEVGGTAINVPSRN